MIAFADNSSSSQSGCLNKDIQADPPLVPRHFPPSVCSFDFAAWNGDDIFPVKVSPCIAAVGHLLCCGLPVADLDLATGDYGVLMNQTLWRYSALVLLLACGLKAGAQQALTWEQVRARFEQSNPTLLADTLNIEESKAEEITAFLRPNPTFTLSADGTQIAPSQGVWKPFAGTFETPSLSYLHERRHKRELRL